MITKNDLKEKQKLRVKKEHETVIQEKELEVKYAGDSHVILVNELGKEISSDYIGLSEYYTPVPLVEPTKENFGERAYEKIEMMILRLSIFTQTTRVHDENIFAIGLALHEMREELSKYYGKEEVQTLTSNNPFLKQQ